MAGIAGKPSGKVQMSATWENPVSLAEDSDVPTTVPSGVVSWAAVLSCV